MATKYVETEVDIDLDDFDDDEIIDELINRNISFSKIKEVYKQFSDDFQDEDILIPALAKTVSGGGTVENEQKIQLLLSVINNYSLFQLEQILK